MKIPVDSLVNHTVLSAPVNHQKDANVHFNFHLSGDESPEQSRRIANAVLALGGLLAPSKSTSAGEITVDVKIDTSQAVEAIRDLADRADKAAQPSYEEVTFGADAHEDGEWKGPPAFEAAVAAQQDPLVELERREIPGDVEIDAAVLTPPPTPPVPTTSGLDAKGLPWDERIHSSSRAINADGTWRYRKNVPDETKRDVEAELRGLIDGLVKAVKDILPPNADFSHGGVVTVPPPVPLSGPEYVLASVGLVSETALKDPNTAVSPPTPPAPPVPTGTLQRTYSDVVNLIMERKVQPDTYVAILGMSLPEFATHVKLNPGDATVMFDAIDAASAT